MMDLQFSKFEFWSEVSETAQLQLLLCCYAGSPLLHAACQPGKQGALIEKWQGACVNVRALLNMLLPCTLCIHS